MSKVLEGLRYSDDHEWVKVEGNVAVVGISDFAQHELGDITYADLPEVDDEVVAGEEFGALESVKASSELMSPVSGRVIEVNAELDDAPEKINEDAYEAWIIKVEMTDPAEVDALMDAAAYQEFTEK
ncbi:MAG: glycine cleavage system protein GcvH [Bacteroidales bacterium]|jgi:glycine cleavage system H protein|nr:glycine cleavage system protein GcvH [Bacteroidales bacterium]MEE3475913.1 glycine cleavage system protein GcvH [Candidatus Cryptobacteroides sp.]MBQ2531619.1 glycine cleavage system protein GcvH [Bacteroidales bacterium]MBQ5411570.1 glycine cleavage system protein GcvH [Bacteroidales bacterium]MBQ6302358.1 glycine cleavage system protein GcvH [Bacteroidales bacterium]